MRPAVRREVAGHLTDLSRTAPLWAAFILTRPLGATVANSLDKPVAQGGLGIGDLTITAVLAGLMVVCVMLIPQRAGGHPTSPVKPC